MNMAKASEADLQMAMDLSNALEELAHYRVFPSAMCDDKEDEDLLSFDSDDREHCIRAISHLFDIAGRGSLMRVVWGLAVILDPANKLVKQDSRIIEHHPDREIGEADTKRLEWLLHRVSRAELRRIGVVTIKSGIEANRIAIDIAMSDEVEQSA